MGSGKSSTGRELARLLKVNFLDIDDLIVERTSRSVNKIFMTDGEPYFRKIESEILQEVSSRPDQVVATGGGIVLNPLNGERMKSTGLVLYLRTSLEVLWERVKHKKDRPLLNTPNPRKALADILRDRSYYYDALADKIFLTDQKLPETVAHEIFKTYFEK